MNGFKNFQTIISSLALISLTPHSYAAGLDQSHVSAIHEKNKTFLLESCKENVVYTDEFCNCVAESSDKSLDDKALAQCSSDASGKVCIDQVVGQAMSNEIMEQCAKSVKPFKSSLSLPISASRTTPLPLSEIQSNKPASIPQQIFEKIVNDMAPYRIGVTECYSVTGSLNNCNAGFNGIPKAIETPQEKVAALSVNRGVITVIPVAGNGILANDVLILTPIVNGNGLAWVPSGEAVTKGYMK